MIYVVGSLRNPRVPEVARELRAGGHEVFDDWHSAGPDADEHWMQYERLRGRTLHEALQAKAAQHTFYWDLEHLDEADGGVLVMPAGKSGHLELGYMCGLGKPCAILLDGEPERWDVMLQFARWGVHYNVKTLLEEIARNPSGSLRLAAQSLDDGRS